MQRHGCWALTMLLGLFCYLLGARLTETILHSQHIPNFQQMSLIRNLLLKLDDLKQKSGQLQIV